MIPIAVVTECLKTAVEAWKEVFYEDGYGQKFNKYSIPPDQQAIATLAVGLLNIINFDGRK